MKTFKGLFFILMMCGTTITFSQNIQTSTIEWSCTSTFTAKPGDVVDEATRVVSSSEQITWYDKNNVARQTFSVVGTNGSWTNVFSNGSIEFSITAGNDRGIAQFSKSSQGTMIRFHIVGDDDTQIYELTVNNINPL